MLPTRNHVRIGELEEGNKKLEEQISMAMASVGIDNEGVRGKKRKEES